MSLLRKLFVCSESSQTATRNTSRRHGTDNNTDLEKQTRTGSDAAEGAATETECAVCQDQLTDPCTVPCGNRHVFCLVCLKGLVSHSSHRTHFPCPLCRKRVRIPFGGVAAFRNSKSLGQKLRSKFPALRPSRSRRHQRRRSRSGLRSTDYVTVSFPVLGYSEELQLDILSTLYAHREGQPVNRERLVEAILDEIGGQRPDLSRPSRNPVWLSEGLDYSDSDQEEEEERRQAAARASAPRLPSRAEPARADPEELDMSVVLQIIADMEENERRHNTNQQTPQRPTATATGCGQSPRPGTNRAALQVPATTGPGRLQNLSRPERGQNMYASQRLEISNTPLHEADSSSTSQRISNSLLHGADRLQRLRTDDAGSARPDWGNTLTQASAEAHNCPSRKPDTSSAVPQGTLTPTTARKTDTSQPAPQMPRPSHNAPIKSQPRTTTPERLGPDTAWSHRPEPLETSPRRFLPPHLASERSPVAQTPFPDPLSSSAWRRDKKTLEETNAASAKSQAADRNPPPPIPQSSSPRKLSSETGDAVQDSCPVSSKSKMVPEGSHPDLKNNRFAPRPRMGSFKLAIAAGQRTPMPQEDESPPLFPLAHPERPASPPAREALRDNLHLSAQKEFQFRPTKITKTEIQEHPVKFTFHQRHATDSAASVGLKEKSEDELVRMMDSADRDTEEEGTPVINSRCQAQEEEHRTRKTPAAAPDSTSRNSRDRLHQKGLRHQVHVDEGLWRPTNEAVSTACPPDHSELTPSNPEPPPPAVQGRDERREHSEEEASTLPLSLADGLQPKHRRLLEMSSTPGWETLSSEDFQEKPRHVIIPGQDFQENAPHRRISSDEFQETAAPSTPPAPSGKNCDDSEWTRRIRGLQRRVMSQAWSTEGHSMGVAQAPALSPSAYAQNFNNRRTEEQHGLDTKNNDVDAIEV